MLHIDRVKKLYRDIPDIVILLISLGVVLRFLFWWSGSPNWRFRAVYYPINYDILSYVSNFEGYKHSRMPFFDVVTAFSYNMLFEALKYKSLTFFNLIVSIISVPLFYFAVDAFFNEDVALYSLVLYAVFPKLLFLNGEGFPEAVAVGFLAMSLYALSRGKVNKCSSKKENCWYFISGLLATVSYLMYVPAVGFGIILALHIYLITDVYRGTDVFRYVPSFPTLSYVSVPGSVGILYLLFGPIRGMILTTTGRYSGGATSSLFIDPVGHSLYEKVFRYLMYAFFDFWWHGRGYETSGAIAGSLAGYRALFDGVFDLFIACWAGVTIILSTPILIGLIILLRRRNNIDLSILFVVFIYIFLYNARNIGWTGVFASRHILPIILPLCIIFGVGLAKIHPKLNKLVSKIPEFESNKTNLTASIIILILLTSGPLVTIAGGQTVARSGASDLAGEAAVDILESNTNSNDTVATISHEVYANTIIYSEFKIYPVLSVETSGQKFIYDERTVRGDVRLTSPNKINQYEDIDYLFIVESNKNSFTKRQQRYVEASLRNGEMIKETTLIRNWPQNRTVNIAIVELD